MVDFRRFSYHTHVRPATKRSPRAAEERQEAAMAKNGDLFDRSGGGKRPTATKDNSYTARDIEVLEGLEPVRKRPGMYIGGTDERAMHHLVAEVLDNAMDEAVAGHADTIYLELMAGDRVLVRDNGRGIPVDPHPKFKNKSALEVILTTLHSGGKFNGKVYATSGGLHGVGVSVVNALSDELDRRGGARSPGLDPELLARQAHDQAEVGRPRPQPARHHGDLPSRPADLRQAVLRARAPLSHGAVQGLPVPRRRDPLEMRQGPAAQGQHDSRRGIVPLPGRPEGLPDLGDRRAADGGAAALRRRGQERDQRHRRRQGRMGGVVADRRGRLHPVLLQHRAHARRRHARIGVPQRPGARAASAMPS